MSETRKVERPIVLRLRRLVRGEYVADIDYEMIDDQGRPIPTQVTDEWSGAISIPQREEEEGEW